MAVAIHLRYRIVYNSDVDGMNHIDFACHVSACRFYKRFNTTRCMYHMLLHMSSVLHLCMVSHGFVYYHVYMCVMVASLFMLSICVSWFTVVSRFHGFHEFRLLYTGVSVIHDV